MSLTPTATATDPPLTPLNTQQDYDAELDLDPSTIIHKDPKIIFLPSEWQFLTISEPKLQTLRPRSLHYFFGLWTFVNNGGIEIFKKVKYKKYFFVIKTVYFAI